MHRQLWLALWTGILCSRTTVTCFTMYRSCFWGRRPLTTAKVLTQASKGVGVQQERQQILANLILQGRALTTNRAKQRQQSTAFSTLASHNEFGDKGEPDGVNDTVESDEDTSTEWQNEDNSNAWQKAASALTAASYTQSVEALFYQQSKIDTYWKEQLLSVTKPSARNMVLQLKTDCPMGYDPSAAPKSSETTAVKAGSLLAFVRENKKRYPDCIILTRVGNFYETFGIDAVLLVEVSGWR